MVIGFESSLTFINFVLIGRFLVATMTTTASYVSDTSRCRQDRIVDYHQGYACDVIVSRYGQEKQLYEAIPRNVSALRMTYWFGEGSIPVIPDLPELRVLELDVGEAREIGNGVFANLRNVEQLYIFHASSSGSSGRQEDFALSLHASKTSSTFAGLKSLSSLVLSDLGITSIPDKTFLGLSSLRILYLNNNKLSILHTAQFDVEQSTASGSLFSDCSRLTSLSLARNQLSSLADVSFVGLVRLRSLDLHGNRIVRLNSDDINASSLFQLEEISEMNLSGNNLTSVQSGTFRAGPRSLKTLYLDSNRMQFLEAGAFEGLVHLTSLDLSGNSLSAIRQGTFRGLRSLRTLTLSANGLSTIDRRVWQALPELRHLDLSKNRISVIDAETFQGLVNINFIDLSENMLVTIQQNSFAHFVNLSFVNLANNQLVTLEGPLLLPSTRPTDGLVLDLSDNPWNCSHCGVLQLITWLINENITLDKVDQTRCNLSDGIPFPLILTATLSNDTNECSTSEVTSQFVEVTTGSSDVTAAVAGDAQAVVRSTLPPPVATSTVETSFASQFFLGPVWITVLASSMMVVALALLVGAATWFCFVNPRYNRRQDITPSRRHTWCSMLTNETEADTGNSSATATLSRSIQRLHLADSLGALVNLPAGSYSPYRAEKHRNLHHHHHHQYFNENVIDDSTAGTYTLRHSTT